MSAVAPDDRREFPRFNLEALVLEVDSKDCEILDVSAEGILFNSPGSTVGSGDLMDFKITVPMLDHIVTMEMKGQVVRNFNGQIACGYEKPTRAWHRFLEILQSRQMEREMLE